MKDFKEELIAKLALIVDKKTMKEFLNVLLTAKEFEEIATRIQIIKKLKQEETQRDIAEELKVGIATVSRGSQAIKTIKDQSWWNTELWR